MDPCVSIAFVLGWELGAVRRITPNATLGPPAEDGGLLRLDGLPPKMRAELSVDLIESNVQKLAGRMTDVRRIDPQMVRALREALGQNAAELSNAVEALHEASLLALAAANSRLGRAYGLGHELADACLGTEDAESFHKAFGPGATKIKNQLSDLASSFPPHSSRAVVLSLRAWESWAAKPELCEKRIRLDRDWGLQGAAIEEALERQGVLWRDLLAGDKRGQDMLDTDHYLQAARSLVAEMASTIWSFIKAMRLPLGITAAVFLIGLVLLIFTGTTGKAVGLLLAILGGLGITGTGIRAQLGKVTSDLQSELWGAAMDTAIADAVLIGPADWGKSIADISVPASGAKPNVGTNIKTLRAFRHHVKQRSQKEVCKLLATDALFLPEGEAPVEGDEEVAAWLMDEPQRTRIASDPGVVEEPAQGVLLSYRERSASVWRVQEGMIRWWRGFPSSEEALAAVREQGLEGLLSTDDSSRRNGG